MKSLHRPAPSGPPRVAGQSDTLLQRVPAGHSEVYASLLAGSATMLLASRGWPEMGFTSQLGGWTVHEWLVRSEIDTYLR